MKIILTNDDGYDAPGLKALTDVAERLGRVVVVAPKCAQSGVGHLVTMRTPLRVETAAEGNLFIVHGSPADCTRLALKAIASDADWVLAGINQGANLGSDVYQSGTVAAAREAAILGIKAIAVSQYVAPRWSVDWQAAAWHLSQILPMLMQAPLAAGHFWNINLPSPITAEAPITHQFGPLDPHPHKYRYRQDGEFYHYEGVIHDRPKMAGRDVDICFGGQISITRLAI